MRRWKLDTKELARDLADLPELPLDSLKQRWAELYGAPPPSRLGRRLMLYAIAYRLQENALGGLKPAVARACARAAEALAAGRPVAPAPVFKTGTRLLRQWQGVTHEVVLLDDGIRYQGKTWRSLSEVARAITGAQWSGPRFFGLKGGPR
ncbi:MAG TPA: DUF2924 domain-containing protein [Magnetospirillum sp.]|nr:DUF2924 domain-containing protein [Magnetospirillum sp.]